MSNKIGMRADKTKVVGIKNEKNGWGQYVMPGNETRLRKDLERFTMTCDLCDGTGRYDEIGEVICEDCGCVISDKPDGPTDIAIYSDKYAQSGNDPDSSVGNRGASGHPNMRPPALNDPGPSGDDSMGGIS